MGDGGRSEGSKNSTQLFMFDTLKINIFCLYGSSMVLCTNDN